MNIGTLNIKVSGSATTIDCKWNDGLTGLPAGEYPLHVSDDQQARAAEEARKDRQHAEAYYRQAELLLTSNEKTLHQKIADLEAQRAKGVPADFHSHRDAWRQALILARDSAKVSAPDIDDRAYWAHEIAAFDRAYSELAAAPQADPAPGMSQPNRLVAYTGCTLLRSLGYEWDEGAKNWITAPQPEREPLSPEQVEEIHQSTWIQSAATLTDFARATEQACAKKWGIKLAVRGAECVGAKR